LPSEVTPSKNWTLVTLPSESLAAAWTVTLAGVIKEAPLVGLVMLTAGGELGITLTVTEAEVVAAPRSSEATAVRVWEPSARLAEML
jgi:hypothetical protein